MTDLASVQQEPTALVRPGVLLYGRAISARFAGASGPGKRPMLAGPGHNLCRICRHVLSWQARPEVARGPSWSSGPRSSSACRSSCPAGPTRTPPAPRSPGRFDRIQNRLRDEVRRAVAAFWSTSAGVVFNRLYSVQASAQIVQCRLVPQAAELHDRAARQERDVSWSLLR